MRVVMDVADPDRSRWVLAGGQSGHPASPAYDDGVLVGMITVDDVLTEVLPLAWKKKLRL